MAPLESARFPRLLREGPLSRSHLAGRAAALRLPRGMVVAVGLGRADQRPQRWWRFCPRDRRDTACHCGARGGASGTRPRRAGRHLAPAGPGDRSQCRRAQRGSRGDRGAQGMELGAVRCSEAEDAERRRVEARLGGVRGRQPGRAPPLLSDRVCGLLCGLRGAGAGVGGRTRAEKRCPVEGLAGPESRNPARGRPEPVLDSFLAKTRCRHWAA